ncbi:hypothetical protein SODALDRAFT_324809 [Sodiomyces alkalinus F11]|uniref:F-box domain-containing protein n=1 Tax=Sodiomyces alkalinus (strain CBS 110278 / VKM F-3762 / F11) TaxID=1314773 RepID=A0A3N2PRR5_SODAK|nr:hypothetical protein SODALDRAFT_324809 [Sodiomyces alkalinus F11]ROT37160.1 hypothetical protein SODALDRAFT_324809 [Sodiomyces alkalinus F11]
MSDTPASTPGSMPENQASEPAPLQDHSIPSTSAVTKLAFETLEAIFCQLSPADFNSARHTCRAWYYAGSGRLLLVEMVQRAGWWSSIKRLVGNPKDPVTPRLVPDDRERMAKWLAREVTLGGGGGGGDTSKSPFVLAGSVDFSSLAAAEHPGSDAAASSSCSTPAVSNLNPHHAGKVSVTFTVSACGRFLMLSRGSLIHVYELNHMCEGTRQPAWHARLKPARHHPLGALRPVTTVVCDGNVVRCSMDTSRGRYAVAALLEERRAVLVEIRRETMTGVLLRDISSSSSEEEEDNAAASDAALRDGYTREAGPPSKKPKTATTVVATCICEERSPFCAPSVESAETGRDMDGRGARTTTYRNLCTGIDPPRSVAVEALTHRNLSRWFPLLAPTDLVHFLPPRTGPGVGRQKLRLVCSAAGEDVQLGPTRGRFGGFGNLYNQALRLPGGGPSPNSNGVSSASAGGHGSRFPLILWRQPFGRPRSAHAQVAAAAAAVPSSPRESRLRRRWKPASAEHLRAVPLRDGQHVLFTDPHTGKLCIGSDASLGPMSQLERIIWLAPPAGASSSTAGLYAAGDDMRHGVRIVGVFPAAADVGEGREKGGADGREQEREQHQLVVFYTIPPDVFDDLTRLNSGALHVAAADGSGEQDFSDGFGVPSWNSYSYGDEGDDEPICILF